MQPIDNIYEPLDLYKNQYQEEHARNVQAFFEDLIKQSGIDEQENIDTVKEIRLNEKVISKVKTKYRIKIGFRNFLIFLTVIFFMASVLLIYTYIKKNNALEPYINLLMGIACALCGIGLILLITLKTNKTIKNLDEYLAELNDKVKDLYQKAWEQMRPLNNLYDWAMTATLIQKTIPLVKLDPYFDKRRFVYLNRKYGLRDNTDKKNSVLYIQSGEIINNPFLLARTLNFRMSTKIYYGSLTISWIVSREVDGKTVYETKTEVLRASVTKPYPTYSSNSFIIYANDAAPDLSFSRRPSNVSGLSEKQIDRKVNKEGKKIEKLARKSVALIDGFTAMANSEFEVLFNALDRDNEVQFRLLFTPLAQKQIIKLIKDQSVGYGDNWSFIKRKRLNFIYPNHLNNIDLSLDPSRYVNYELAASKKIFNNYNTQFFKDFYFAMAPILAIPLYQQYQPQEFIYDDDNYYYNVCSWEHESIANYLKESHFKHPESITKNILKTNIVSSGKDYDVIAVTAYGFKGVKRVEYVSVRGGDGKYHRVPVPWVEYIPVDRTSNVVVKVADKINRSQFINNKYGNQSWQTFIQNIAKSSESFIFRKSLLAFITKSQYNDQINQSFDEILFQSKK
ncbi:MAG: hypothetical protein PHT03_05485 [Bacilli bacterium]|nr:hypothetical protein [Bacilli bacterium]